MNCPNCKMVQTASSPVAWGCGTVRLTASKDILISLACMEIKRLKELDDWQPGELAPKDGRVIMLLMPTPAKYRIILPEYWQFIAFPKDASRNRFWYGKDIEGEETGWYQLDYLGFATGDFMRSMPYTWRNLPVPF